MNNHDLRLLQARLQSIHVGYLGAESALRAACDLVYTSRPADFALEGVTAIAELVAGRLLELNQSLEDCTRTVPADGAQGEVSENGNP